MAAIHLTLGVWSFFPYRGWPSLIGAFQLGPAIIQTHNWRTYRANLTRQVFNNLKGESNELA